MARPPKVSLENLPDTDDCIDHGQKGSVDGYGHSQRELLHRRVFRKIHGYLPEVVMHTCDNPRCVNPKHLVPGTWNLNNKDRAAKGRSAKIRIDLRKLNLEQAEEIRKRYVPRNGTGPYDKINGVAAIAREYSVDVNVIYNIVKRRTHVL